MAYTAEDIDVLEGLEPVRLRPGMYINGTGKPGLHHLLWEIVDNSVDEAMNGHANTIEIVLHKDLMSASVIDNGRGIPVDKHKKTGKTALEVILTTLHAGGKFSSSNYGTSGGLHGVGSSVVNALSTEMVAKVKRDGKVYTQTFSRGVPTSKLKSGGSSRGTGTEIFFRPDPEIFEDTEFDPEWIAERLENTSYLHPGLKLVFKNEAKKSKVEFKNDDGISALLDQMQKHAKTAPVHPEPIYFCFENAHPEIPKIEVCLVWTEDTREQLKVFANGIPNADGGTHEQGFKDGVLRALRAYFDTHDVAPKSLNIISDDIREGLKAVVSVFIVDPQFQGQSKAKLNNTFVKSAVASLLKSELEQHLHSNPSTGDAIAGRIVQAAKARAASRTAIQQVRRKKTKTNRLNLPGKLADCSSNDPEECELFIVEGDSAGGNAKQGRDRRTQAILPLRGKVLNVEQAPLSKVVGNKELKDVVDALGCGIGDQCDPSTLRYGKIILLMDADSDGHHIATLMLTFFYRHMKQLIQGGHLFIAQPPLFRIDHGSETYWALDDAQRDAILKKIEGKRSKKISVQRFKGLGEMMAKTLKETTLDPDQRRLLQVQVDAEEETDATIKRLMGKEASVRFSFIMENAETLKEIDV